MITTALLRANNVFANARSSVFRAAGTTAPAAPTSSAAAPAGGVMPAINPDMSAPGMQGLLHISDYLAAYLLWACVVAILLGALMVALGPRLGFHSAKSIGMGGIIGGLALGAVISLSTTGVNTSVRIFKGTA